MRRRTHVVDREEAGRTVAWILHRWARVSHRVARGIVDAGLVRLDGTTVTDPAAWVREGNVLEARFDPDTRYRPRPRRADRGPGYRLILDDPDLMVVEKAAGVPTVPTGPADGGSLLSRLLAGEKPAVRRKGLWVVHRIDRHVSGLVVVARNEETLAGLRRQFVARTPLREYLALCEAAPAAAEGRWVSRLRQAARSHRVLAAGRRGEGIVSSLRYRVLERMAHGCLVEVHLETGRRNQIRVQFAEMRCPLVGDRTYGRPSPLIDRVALHAARLEFTHPRSGRRVACASKPPPDFQRALRRLRAGARPAEGAARDARRSGLSAPGARRKSGPRRRR